MKLTDEICDWDKEGDLEYFKNLWSCRKHSGMSHNKEDWDKRAHKWAEEPDSDEDRSRRRGERVAETCKYLRYKGLLTENDDVIDIGCGPGRFVADFARTARSVTGVDISPNMCFYGQQYANSQGLKNVSFIPCDFKETDVVQAGWEKAFDLVFSSITPAMSSLDSLEKSIKMSRAYCFQSNFVRSEDDLLYSVLAEALPGVPVIERSIRSTYILINILWLKGYFPEVRYYREVGHRKQTVCEKLAHEFLNQAPQAGRSEEVVKKVMDSLMKRADSDGMVERSTALTYSWVLWDVRNKV